MSLIQDIHLIAPMLVYLGYMPNPAKSVNLSDEELLGEPEPKAHFYRCKHFDPKARVCSIYEIRPVMCREYPYGSACNYDACTWIERKEKRETTKERCERLRVLKEKNDAV